MAQLTTNTAVDDVFATWINKKFISDLEWSLQHQKFTTKAVIEKGIGASIGRFVDWSVPPGIVAGTGTGSYTALGSTALTEGTPTEHEITSLTTNPTNITIYEYGEFIKVSQLYDYAAVSTTRERMAKRLSDGAAVCVDGLVRIQAHSSTTPLYATGVMSGGQTTATTQTALGAATLILAHKTLFANGAKGFSGISGHPDGHYAAVITPQQELDVVTEISTGRVYWSNAVVNIPGKMGQDKFVNGYIGSIYGTAVYVTQNFVTATVGTTNQVGYVYADGGVGAMAFGDMAPKVIFNEVNSPYKNVNSIAWHVFFGTGLISSSRVVKLYSLGA